MKIKKNALTIIFELAIFIVKILEKKTSWFSAKSSQNVAPQVQHNEAPKVNGDSGASKAKPSQGKFLEIKIMNFCHFILELEILNIVDSAERT